MAIYLGSTKISSAGHHNTSAVTNSPVAAKFQVYEQDDASSIRCTSHTPDEIRHCLESGLPVLANIYIGQAEIYTAHCWIQNGDLYVGDRWTDSGWHFDTSDGEAWIEY